MNFDNSKNGILVTWSQFFERWINLYITGLVSLNCDLSHGYTVFTNGGHTGKNWCLVAKARRWRINKNCKRRLSVNLQSV